MKASDLRNLLILGIAVLGFLGYAGYRYWHHAEFMRHYEPARRDLAGAWKYRDLGGPQYQAYWEDLQDRAAEMRQLNTVGFGDRDRYGELQRCADSVALYHVEQESLRKHGVAPERIAESLRSQQLAEHGVSSCNALN